MSWSSDKAFYLNNSTIENFNVSLFSTQNTFWMLEPLGGGKIYQNKSNISICDTQLWGTYHDISNIGTFISSLCSIFENTKSACGWGNDEGHVNLVFFETSIPSENKTYYVPFFYHGDNPLADYQIGI